jgi:hypothetical protein
VINTDIATKYSVQSLELSIKMHALSSSFEKLNRIDYMPRPLWIHFKLSSSKETMATQAFRVNAAVIANALQDYQTICKQAITATAKLEIDRLTNEFYSTIINGTSKLACLSAKHFNYVHCNTTSCITPAFLFYHAIAFRSVVHRCLGK